MQYQPFVEVTRGGMVESTHYGAVAIADAHGNLVAWSGDPDQSAYLRSSAKPLQALPLVASGAAEKFGLAPRQLAVVCASHTGTDMHVEVIASIQERVGVREADLLCGVQAPGDRETARRLEAEGLLPTPLRHNCSGKHSGMLALARHIDAPTQDYVNPEHPVQKRILQAVAEMCGVAPESIELATDGCSAPVFGLPLRAAATAFARLADPSGLPPTRAAACQAIFRAMTSHPEMVAGPGRFDTRLMQVTGGRLLAKGGAEGFQAISLPGASPGGPPWPATPYAPLRGPAAASGPDKDAGPSPALGMAFKIADGDLGRRALSVAVLAVLGSLGAMQESELDEMSPFAARRLTNDRGLVVGEIRPCLDLQSGARSA